MLLCAVLLQFIFYFWFLVLFLTVQLLFFICDCLLMVGISFDKMEILNEYSMYYKVNQNRIIYICLPVFARTKSSFSVIPNNDLPK